MTQNQAMTHTLTSLCAMLIACRNWMASPMLFMMSDASEFKGRGKSYFNELQASRFPLTYAGCGVRVHHCLKNTFILGKHKLVTSFCEGLVSPVLDSTEKLTTIHAEKRIRIWLTLIFWHIHIYHVQLQHVYLTLMHVCLLKKVWICSQTLQWCVVLPIEDLYQGSTRLKLPE